MEEGVNCLCWILLL